MIATSECINKFREKQCILKSLIAARRMEESLAGKIKFNRYTRGQLVFGSNTFTSTSNASLSKAYLTYGFNLRPVYLVTDSRSMKFSSNCHKTRITRKACCQLVYTLTEAIYKQVRLKGGEINGASVVFPLFSDEH